MNMKAAFWRKHSWVRHYPISEVLVVSFLTAIVSYPNIFTRYCHFNTSNVSVQSTELVAALFKECTVESNILGLCGKLSTAPTIILLLVAAIIGTLFASITFGMQIPAGIILPSMAIGALYGRAIRSPNSSMAENFPTSMDVCKL